MQGAASAGVDTLHFVQRALMQSAPGRVGQACVHDELARRACTRQLASIHVPKRKKAMERPQVHVEGEEEGRAGDRLLKMSEPRTEAPAICRTRSMLFMCSLSTPARVQ